MAPQPHPHDPERSKHLQELLDNHRVQELLNEVTVVDVAEAWNCYHRRNVDDSDDPDWWAVELWLDPLPADVRRSGLIALVDTVDDDQLGMVGAGPLEDFVSDDDDDLRWLEEQAALNARLRQALRNAWVVTSVAPETLARLDAAAGAVLKRPLPRDHWPPEVIAYEAAAAQLTEVGADDWWQLEQPTAEQQAAIDQFEAVVANLANPPDLGGTNSGADNDDEERS